MCEVRKKPSKEMRTEVWGEVRWWSERPEMKTITGRLEMLHQFWVLPGEAFLLQPLLQEGDAPAGAGQVGQEQHQDHALGPRLVQPPACNSKYVHQW